MNSPVLEEIVADAPAKEAWRRVLRNDGCAGADAVSIRDLDTIAPEQWNATRAALLRGNYQPQPVRRVWVPKSSGGQRALGIPAVLDRWVLQVLHLGLSPIWEPHFSAQSFAYRPGRGPWDAVRAITAAPIPPDALALHLDIENFFDSVPHHPVIERLSSRVTDFRVISLIEKFLQAGIWEGGTVSPSHCGLHQGSPLSPLLANIVLHDLDVWLDKSSMPFARYADDVLIIAPENVLRGHLPGIEKLIAGLGLKLNVTKTFLGPLSDTDFLGFNFIRGSHNQFRPRISRASLKNCISTGSAIVLQALSEDDAVRRLSEFFRGWAAFFAPAGDDTALHEARELLADLLRARRWFEMSLKNRAALIGQNNNGIQPENSPLNNPALCSLLRQVWPTDAFGLRMPASTDRPNRAVDYNGRSPAPADNKSGFAMAADWPATLRLWWKRLLAGRLVRLGMDVSRPQGRWLPSFSNLRLRAGWINIRFRPRR